MYEDSGCKDRGFTKQALRTKSRTSCVTCKRARASPIDASGVPPQSHSHERFSCGAPSTWGPNISRACSRDSWIRRLQWATLDMIAIRWTIAACTSRARSRDAPAFRLFAVHIRAQAPLSLPCSQAREHARNPLRRSELAPSHWAIVQPMRSTQMRRQEHCGNSIVS